MFSTCKSFLCHFAYCLIIICTVVSSDDIPTMLWNIKGNALHIKPASALGVNDKILVESLKDIHHQDSRILVFAVNKLSLEDFNANDKPLQNSTLHNIESFLDQQPHMLLPNVKDPLNYLHKSHCGVQEIVVDNKIDDNIMQLASSALQRSCVVILHISDDGIVVKEDEVKSVFMPSFENSNKDIVGVFTGVKSSWGTPSSDHHMFRNLLEIAPLDDNFVNYNACIIMYAENITLSSKESNTSMLLPFPPLSLDGSSCSNASVLQLTFKGSGPLTSVTIKLNFTQISGSWKTIGNIITTDDKEQTEEMELSTEVIEAPIGFSYSCGNLLIKTRNSTRDYSLKMDGFQIQPYQVKEVFSDSFDCVPFFTIPIWMGIFVSLIFIAIANCGIYALFSVHTMDRFDDPKGKTISVATTAE